MVSRFFERFLAIMVLISVGLLSSCGQEVSLQSTQGSRLGELKGKTDAIAEAFQKYYDHNHVFPAWAIRNGDKNATLLSWRVSLLPYLGLQELYDEFHLDESWDSEHNSKLIEKMPDVFKTSDRNGVGYSGFLIPLSDPSTNVLRKKDNPKDPDIKVITIFPSNFGQVRKVDIEDGLDKTILFNTGPEEIWTKPTEQKTDLLSNRWPLGLVQVDLPVFVVFADGKPHQLTGATRERIRAYYTINGADKTEP